MTDQKYIFLETFVNWSWRKMTFNLKGEEFAKKRPNPNFDPLKIQKKEKKDNVTNFLEEPSCCTLSADLSIYCA